MKSFMLALLQCSLSMSLLTLLYAAVSPLLARRYAPKWRYIAWLAIGTGWLIPFRPFIELPFVPAQRASTPLLMPAFSPASPILSAPTEVLAPASEAATGGFSFSLWEMGFFLWLAGVVAVLAYHSWRHIRFMHMVKRWSEVQPVDHILPMLDRLKQELGIKTAIEYKVCSSISSPMMIGFTRPVILMPPIPLTDDERMLILRHELIHYKRHDLWYKTIVLAATILHWFNPLAYFMARATSVQCEISCDALVLEHEDIQTRKQYGATILAIVRGAQSPNPALSTTFYGGKRGMKNRLLSMLDSKRKKTGVALIGIVLAGTILTGATWVAGEASSARTIPDTAFSADEYHKLLTLQFKGYKDMSVAQFQQKVWRATDTSDYGTLLDRMYKDDQLLAMKDTNDLAAFLFYELVPLTTENWTTRSFSGSDVTDYKAVDNAHFAYDLQLTINDADHLTVKEYDQTRVKVVQELSSFFQARTFEELQDEPQMRKSIDKLITRLTARQKGDLSIAIEYEFMPLIRQDDPLAPSSAASPAKEKRQYPNATVADYRSLMKLKTSQYRNQTLTAFNAALLEWANADFERCERITGDTVFNDFAVSLTPEELAFVKLTVLYSGNENAAMIKSINTGKPKEDAGFSRYFPGKTLQKDGRTVAGGWLDYQGSYHIADENQVTVGERDDRVGGVVRAIEDFWINTSLEKMLTLNKQDILARLQAIAAQYSNDAITLTIIPNALYFEKMDERSTSQ